VKGSRGRGKEKKATIFSWDLRAKRGKEKGRISGKKNAGRASRPGRSKFSRKKIGTRYLIKGACQSDITHGDIEK